MTGGQQDDLGGSFQRHLQDLENNGMLKQTTNKERKQTMILFNIEKIEFFLLDKTVKRTEDKIGETGNSFRTDFDKF
jgi:hypothetical protein